MTDPTPAVDDRIADGLRLRSNPIRVGVRVILRPRRQSDPIDLAMAGRRATVEAIEPDYEGRVYLEVTIDDDSGRNVGADPTTGQRFFFRPEDLAPMD